MDSILFPQFPQFPKELFPRLLEGESPSRIARLRRVSRAWNRSIMRCPRYGDEQRAIYLNRMRRDALIISRPVRDEVMSVLLGDRCQLFDLHCGGFKSWDLNSYLDDLCVRRSDNFLAITLRHLLPGSINTLDLDSLVYNFHPRLAKLEIDGCADLHLEDFIRMAKELGDRLILSRCPNQHRRRGRAMSLQTIRGLRADSQVDGLDFSPPVELEAGEFVELMERIPGGCQTLNFAGSALDDEGVAALARHYSQSEWLRNSLRVVDFSNCHSLTSEAVSISLPLIAGSALQSGGFVSFEGCSGITKLNLSNTVVLSDWLLSKVVDRVTPKMIRSVNLSGCTRLSKRSDATVDRLAQLDSRTRLATGVPWIPRPNLADLPDHIRQPGEFGWGVDIQRVGRHVRSIVIDDCWTLTDSQVELLFSALGHCEELRLAGLSGLSPAGWEQVTSALVLQRPPLRRLELPDTSEVGPDRLRRIIRSSPRLEHLAIVGCEGVDLSAILPNLPQLRSLSIRLGSMSNQQRPAAYDLDAILTLGQRSQLEELTLVDTEEGPLQIFGEPYPSLKRLTLEVPCADDAVIARLSEHAPRLQHAGLCGTAITDGGLSVLVDRCADLRGIDLQECFEVTEAGLAALARVAGRLRHLNLAYCEGLSGASVVHLLAAAPALEHLDLTAVMQLETRQMCAIFSGCTRLRTLILAYNDVVDDEVLGLVAERLTLITKLDISGVNDLTTRGVFLALKQMPQLRELAYLESEPVDLDILYAIATYNREIRSLTIENIAPSAVRALLTLPASLPHLEQLKVDRLDLKGSGIVDTELEIFAPHARWLSSLDLTDCDDLTPQGLEVVASSCARLKRLCASGVTAFTDRVVTIFTRGCKSLTSLTLAGCRAITGASLIELADELAEIRELDIEDCARVHGQALAYLAGRHPLRRLNIVDCHGLHGEDCEELLSQCLRPSLQILRIGDSHIDPPPFEFVELFDGISIPHLRELHLYGWMGEEDAIPSVASQFPLLERLNCSGAYLGPERLDQLAGACPNLVHLHPTANALSGDPLRTISTFFPHLQTLDLLASDEMEGHDVMAAISGLGFLRILKLNDVRFGIYTGERGHLFDEVLFHLAEECTQLEELWVTETNWQMRDEETVRRVAHTLLPQLKILVLDKCKFDYRLPEEPQRVSRRRTPRLTNRPSRKAPNGDNG